MLNNPPTINGTSTNSIIRFDQCINQEIVLGADAALNILSANLKRIYAAFINNSDADITLVLSDSSKAVINKGIILKARGGSYEITQLNLYVGKISAISDVDAKLSFVECSQ